MAMLDLQKMAAPTEKEKAPAGSRASKQCTVNGGGGGHGGHDNESGLSVALCAF